MTPVSRRTAVSIASLAACLFATAATRPDRRVVDTAEAGNANSEAVHGYAGDDVTVGEVGGKSYRQARGWMHYALKTFEDTPVTVACTFISTDNVAHSYDVVVEDSVIASRTYTPQSSSPTVIEIAVPFVLTKGKANVAVVIRARGGPTPALQLIRTIQDHYEFDHTELDHHERTTTSWNLVTTSWNTTSSVTTR
ncbi:MAG: DUF6805 domain-containing protein [Gemmatimonas sp.]